MEIKELKEVDSIKFLIEERDVILGKFNELIKSGGLNDGKITDCFNLLLIKQKQLNLMDDCIIAYNIIGNEYN